ncbi:MAG: polysaccharide biosynthesis protein, partial [Gammaproteobacteria bacterium]|nr:polysaccharide biosynthesis protein [Gammaproteobacteria bacterium]
AIANLVAAPLRWTIAYGALSLIYLVGSRMIARLFLNRRNPHREQVIIYGAGEGGARLAAALFSGDDYLPVAMVDDNLHLHGKRVNGMEVFPPSRLQDVIESTGASGVLLAIPSASRHRRRQILEQLSEFPVHVRTIPEIRDLVSGKSRVDDLSEVDVKDILGRDEVPPNLDLLHASVAGKNVMVTGAGGSIGSELCRQIVKLGPSRLVCFDISEPALYEIGRELNSLLAQENVKCDVVSLLGSAHHEKRVTEALQAFEIQTVYHAAAYKHVPIVEHNLFEGIHNNVFGTLHTARAAVESGVETFVLISTDKAVNPTNVMGATKRLAEQVLQAYNSRAENTRFCMVRFGNVLESSGSVVPLFREQIRNGGPVTVTHRDIIRYFMTIPEAAQLVIQASSMAKGGDVFVLDMGNPVRIQDLARRMINLMGLTIRNDENPDGDIEIQYIGLRPAEKLYEELLIGSNVTGTEHPRIMRADEESLSFEELDELIGELKSASANFDYAHARTILQRAVAEYAPTNGIDDLVWLSKNGTLGDADDTKVVDFPAKQV